MTTDPIKDPTQLQMLANYFLDREKYRDYAMIILGVNLVLRISDLLSLKWSDLMNENTGHFFKHINVTECKTKKSKRIFLNESTLKALRLLYPYRRSAYVFASRNKKHDPITRTTAWKIIKSAADDLGLDGNIACHSLRKTRGYHLRKQNNVSQAVITKMYNHNDYKTTERYLGITQDEIDKAYNFELFSLGDNANVLHTGDFKHLNISSCGNINTGDVFQTKDGNIILVINICNTPQPTVHSRSEVINADRTLNIINNLKFEGAIRLFCN